MKKKFDCVAMKRVGSRKTKRGKPMAQLHPSISGKLSGALVFEKDIVSPLGAKMWEAAH